MDEEYVYIITNFIKGHNMEDFIYQPIPVNSRDKVSVAQGVTEGVAYLHDKNLQIIHQD